MHKSKLVAAALAAALVFSSATSSFARQIVIPPAPAASNPGVVAGIFGCVVAIMLAALAAGERDKRELTTEEAITCGLLFWLTPPPSNQQ